MATKNVINHKNVKRADEFSYELLDLPAHVVSKFAKKFEKPSDFLLMLRVSPPDRYGKEIYEKAKEKGFIRSDSIYISLALLKLHDAVTEGHPLYVYIRTNMQYERIVAMPEEIVKSITYFIWNYDGNKNTRSLTHNERQILFDHYAIYREPTNELSVAEIARRYYPEREDGEDFVGRTLKNAVWKLRRYGDDFIGLYHYEDLEYEQAMTDRVNEMRELTNPKHEKRIHDLLSGYISECKRKSRPVSYDFVDVGYILIDERLRQLVGSIGITNLQQLINAYGDKSIYAVAKPDSNDYRAIKSQTKNFFYRFLIKMPESIR